MWHDFKEKMARTEKYVVLVRAMCPSRWLRLLFRGLQSGGGTAVLAPKHTTTQTPESET